MNKKQLETWSVAQHFKAHRRMKRRRMPRPPEVENLPRLLKEARLEMSRNNAALGLIDSGGWCEDVPFRPAAGRGAKPEG